MKFLRNLKHIFSITLLSLLIIFGSVYIFRDEFFHELNGFFLYRTGGGVWQDYFHKHKLTPSSDIAIIKIDERSLNELQAEGKLQRSDVSTLTIPKSLYAVLVDRLESAGVRGIAFDIIFQNKDEDEGVFASTMRKYSNIVIAVMRSNGGKCILDAEGPYTTCPGAPRSVYRDIPWGIVDMDDAYVRPVSIDIFGTPYQALKVASGSISVDQQKIFTLPLALAKTQSGFTIPPILKQSSIYNPYFNWQTDEIIQKKDTISVYLATSLIDVLNAPTDVLAATFSGKYVFIGESGTMIHDSIISPVSGTSMNGVETHAHFLDGILQNKMLVSIGTELMMGIIVFLTCFTVLIYYSSAKYLSPILAIAILAGLLFVSRWMYDVWRLVGDIFLIFLAGGIVTYPMTFIYRFFVVDREKRELQNNFGHYIDPHVVQQIVDRGENIQLGGETRVLSVLFSDIAGFTTISESMKPRELFFLMSSYLSNMTDVLIEKGGTLDKYIGDAVMGFFGAPLAYEDHAMRAADTALAMRERLPAFNGDLVKHGIQPIDFRIGIATGEVMVGNIGSHDRFNYTVLGDAVNLASRLEGTGKEYEVHIIVPESTKALLGHRYLLRELDTIAVKGKLEWVRIYELVGYSQDYPDRTIYVNYEKALALYRKAEYREAGKIWQMQAKIDPPSRVMMYRCVDILKGNITVEDGIYRMTHK